MHNLACKLPATFRSQKQTPAGTNSQGMMAGLVGKCVLVVSRKREGIVSKHYNVDNCIQYVSRSFARRKAGSILCSATFFPSRTSSYTPSSTWARGLGVQRRGILSKRHAKSASNDTDDGAEFRVPSYTEVGLHRDWK